MVEAIDAHVHLWTDDRKRYPRNPGERDSPPPRFAPEDFLAHAHPAGVARAVLVQMSFYRFDNSYMLDCMRAHPRVFSGIGIVDSLAANPQRAMKELRDKGVRGFRIVPGDTPRTWLEAPGMRKMWQCGAELGLAICPLIGPDAIVSIDRMCESYPDTRVVIDHIARIGIDGQIRDSDIRFLCGLAKHRSVHVKISAFYALGLKRSPYRDLEHLILRVFENFGPRRLMWGSDCPFQLQNGHEYKSSIALVREGLPFLSLEDREWVLAKTAQTIFFATEGPG